MIEWLREERDKHLLEMAEVELPWLTAEAYINAFLLHLHRTGASPCDGCECKAAFVLQELRADRFTETPLRDEEYDND